MDEKEGLNGKPIISNIERGKCIAENTGNA